jgi:N-methylhydantoinase A
LLFDRLYDRCEEKRKGVGISETELHVYRSTEMRYIGQSYELEVPFPEGKGEITKEIIQEVVRRFHDIHYNMFQHCSPDSPVEFMAFRTVFSQKPKLTPVIRHLKPGNHTSAKGQRNVYFEEYKETVATPIYERAALVPGQRLKGAAIVEQPDTTTVIYPHQVAEVDEWGNLILTMLPEGV